MKDFDEVRAARPVKDEEERSFKLGGETFVVKPSVRADVLVATGNVTSESNPADDLAAFDEMIMGFLEEADHERYLQLRRREEDPITFYDLDAVVVWLVRVHTGRPTQEQSSSGTGPATMPPLLTDVSSPPPAASAG